MKVSFEKVLPIDLVDGPVLINKYGDITFCFSFEGRELFTMDQDGFINQNKAIDSAYNFLGDDSFVIHKQDVCLEDNYKSPNPEFNTFLSRSFYRHFDGKKYYKYKSYLFVTKIDGLGVKRDYSTPRQVGLNGKQLRNRPDDVKDLVFAFASNLRRAGIELKPLKEEETYSILEGFFSAYKSGLLSDLQFAPELTIGSSFVGLYALNSDENQPEAVAPFALNEDYSIGDAKIYSDLLYGLGYGLKANHIVNTMIFLDGQRHWKGALEKRTKELNSMKLFSLENAKKADDNETFLHATINQDGKKVVRCHVNVIFWDESQEHFKALKTDVKGKFLSLGMIAHEANWLDRKALFLSSCPGNSGTMPLSETFVTHSDAATCYLIKESVVDRSKGNPSTHGLQFVDRASNIPMFRDSWYKPYETKQISNRNVLVIGETGGGKSSSVIEAFRQYLEMNFSITAIDIGRSFEVLGKLYGGNYIVYEQGMSIGLNPFQVPDSLLTVETLEFLSSFIPVLWRPEKDFSNDEIAALEKILLNYYKAEKHGDGFRIGIDGKVSSVKEFYNWVASNRALIKELISNRDDFFDIESFLISMEKYVDGKFEQLLMPRDSQLIDPNNRLTIWELDNIKDHPTLFPIFGMLITHMTTQVMWKNNLNKIFWFDEAWKVLEKKGMPALVKYLYKTARKFNAAVGMNIQTIGDLNIQYGNIEETVLGNSAIKWIMSHKAEILPGLIKRMDWKDDSLIVNLLRSIKNDLYTKYPYTEHLNIVGSDFKVVRVMVSPEQRVNLMSEMADKKVLFEMISKEGGMEKGIEKFVEYKGWNI